MAGRFCQDCGAPNEAIARYCAQCGSELRAGVPPAAPPGPFPAPGPHAPSPAPVAPPAPVPPPLYSPSPYPPMYGSAYPYAGPYPAYPNYAVMERQKQVDRTKTGFLLLAVGFLIGWVPLIGAVGGLLAFIGAILVILGRKAFGDRHATLVIISIVVYIASFVLSAVFIAWFFLAGLQSSIEGNPRPFLSAFWPFIGGLIVASAIGAVAQVLFVHELEKPIGRYLLYGALVASIVIPIGAVLVLMPALSAVLDGIASGTITNPNDPRLAALEGVQGLLTLASVVPSVLFGIAYFLAWQRIDRREIPGDAALQGGAAPSWPYPYVPPATPFPPPASAAPPPSPPAGPPPGAPPP